VDLPSSSFFVLSGSPQPGHFSTLTIIIIIMIIIIINIIIIIITIITS